MHKHACMLEKLPWRTSRLDENVVKVALLLGHQRLNRLHKLRLDCAAHAAVGQLHPLPQVGSGALESSEGYAYRVVSKDR